MCEMEPSYLNNVSTSEDSNNNHYMYDSLFFLERKEYYLMLSVDNISQLVTYCHLMLLVGNTRCRYTMRERWKHFINVKSLITLTSNHLCNVVHFNKS